MDFLESVVGCEFFWQNGKRRCRRHLYLFTMEIDIKLHTNTVYFLTGIYFRLFTIKIKNNNLNIGMVYSNHKKQYEKNHVNWHEI